MRKVRFINPRQCRFTVHYAKQDAHDEGILPGLIRKNRNQVNLDAEFIDIGLLKDDEIASQPWFLEFDMRSQGIEKSCDPEGGFWKEIPQDLREQFQKGNGYLLMNYFLEGFTDHFFVNFYNYTSKIKNFPYNRIIYLSSALTIKEKYAQWCRDHGIDSSKQIQCWNSTAWAYALDKFVFRPANKPIKREKKFLFLNRRLRRHRVLFPCLFADAGLFDQGLISYFPDDDLGIGIDHIDGRIVTELAAQNPGLLEKYRRGFATTKPNLPYIVDTTDNYFNHAVTMAEDLYERTYFSVVSETFYFEDDLTNDVFPSEKTFKPMCQLQPFVMVSRPHFLKELRKVGFKTFSPWIDESYDDIEDDYLRADAITKEVSRLANLPDEDWMRMISEMQGILQHNQHAVRSVGKAFNDTDLRNLYNHTTEPLYSLKRDHTFLSSATSVNDAFGPVMGFDGYNDPTIHEEGVSPRYGTAWIQALFRYNNTVSSYARVDDLTHYAHPWFYTVEISSSQELREGITWERIPQRTRDIMLSGKGYLLIGNIQEGETSSVFRELHNMIDRNPELPANRVVLVSGAVNIEALYEEFLQHYPQKQKVFVTYANLFYSRTRETWKNTIPFGDNRLQPGTLLMPYQEKKVKPRKFLCLNRVAKPHRIALVAMLYEKGLLNRGIVSCHVGSNNSQLDWANHSLRQYSDRGLFSSSSAIQLSMKLPMVIDKNNVEEFVTYEFAEHLYFDSYFTVVTESFFFPRDIRDNVSTDKAIFPTEKVYKPILFGHPFIVVAPKGFLQHIRSQGFETFPELFDESYDDIDDDIERMKAVVKEIERVSNMSDMTLLSKITSIRKKLAKNQRVLMKEHLPTEFLSLLSRIANEQA